MKKIIFVFVLLSILFSGVLVSCGNPLIRAITDKLINEYNVGDIGPGGGIIFYHDRAGFQVYQSATDTVGITCHYLEVAPAGSPGSLEWAPTASTAYGSVTGLSSGTLDYFDWAIGRGKKNTVCILIFVVIPASTYAPAADFCDTYTSPNGTSDWFLPSKYELNELYKRWNAEGRPAKYNLPPHEYWSSSQDGVSNAYAHQFFYGIPITNDKALSSYYARPIRAF